MKKQILFLLVVALLLGCKSTGGGGSISSFSDVVGKELKLIEVQIDSTPFNRIVLYDRADLIKHKHDVYTLTFSGNMVSGTAAPNKYSAPYTRQDKNLSIKVMRSTQMAPLVQPEKLQEYDFYNYMQKVESWTTDKGRLVLNSKTDDGIAVRLIFAL
jgi:heat shock protein HslJ